MEKLEDSGRLAVGVFLFVGIGVSLATVIWCSQTLDAWLLSLGTEIIGAALAYVVFNMVIGRREKLLERRVAKEQEKQDLITRMGSEIRETAITAVEQLRQRGCLTDGSLQGKNLSRAALSGAVLSDADLRGAILVLAHLDDAHLCRANLSRSIMMSVDLDGANLSRANLEGANLGNASLRGANLSIANLVGADLTGADLTGASLGKTDLSGAIVTDVQLAQAESLRDARMPDGTRFGDNWETEFAEWREQVGSGQ
jgi:hypothetical protein